MGLFRRRVSQPAVEEVKESVHFHNQIEIEQEIADFDVATAASSATLAPNDLFLLDKLGLEPVQVVFGNVVYSMGLRGVFRSFIRALTRGEMYDFSKLNEDARLLARNRMLRAAKALNADQVVSVEITVREYADFLEVTAIGTAVRKTGRAVSNAEVVVAT